jgi:tRNA A37 methylthiotransferase MiaB
MKYKVISLGCPKNLVDSEYLAHRLDAAGHVLAEK